MKDRVIKQSEFEKNNLILIGLTLVASVLNYLFQILLGRFLSVDDYGVINSLLSLITLLTFPGIAIATFVAKECAIANSWNKKDFSILIAGMLKVVIVILFIIGIMELCLSETLTSLFGISNIKYVIACIAISLVTIIVQFMFSILQGEKKFFEFGFQSLITSFFKLTLSALLIVMFKNKNAVLVAFLFAELATLIYCIMHADVEWSMIYKCNISILNAMRKWKHSIGYIVIIQFFQVVISNGDVLIVKALYSEKEAGLYSAIIVFAKIPMFISSTLSNVLLPTVVNCYKQGERTFVLLLKTICYGIIPWLGVFGVLIFQGEFLLGWLYGEEYMQAAELVVPVNIYVLSLICITIIINYAIAIEKGKFLTLSSVVGMILSGILVCLRNDNLYSMWIELGICLLALFFVNIIYLRYENTIKKVIYSIHRWE